jgi:hypothetical protein
MYSGHTQLARTCLALIIAAVAAKSANAQAMQAALDAQAMADAARSAMLTHYNEVVAVARDNAWDARNSALDAKDACTDPELLIEGQVRFDQGESDADIADDWFDLASGEAWTGNFLYGEAVTAFANQDYAGALGHPSRARRNGKHHEPTASRVSNWPCSRHVIRNCGRRCAGADRELRT